MIRTQISLSSSRMTSIRPMNKGRKDWRLVPVYCNRIGQTFAWEEACLRSYQSKDEAIKAKRDFMETAGYHPEGVVRYWRENHL